MRSKSFSPKPGKRLCFNLHLTQVSSGQLHTWIRSYPAYFDPLVLKFRDEIQRERGNGDRIPVLGELCCYCQLESAQLSHVSGPGVLVPPQGVGRVSPVLLKRKIRMTSVGAQGGSCSGDAC